MAVSDVSSKHHVGKTGVIVTDERHEQYQYQVESLFLTGNGSALCWFREGEVETVDEEQEEPKQEASATAPTKKNKKEEPVEPPKPLHPNRAK